MRNSIEILYVSKLCSKRQFDELFKSCRIKPQQQAQKFHHLLLSGLSEHSNIQITAMSGLPLSRAINKRIWWHGSSEIENKIEFKYLPHLNIQAIGHAVAFIAALFAAARWCMANSKSERYIFCDVLNLTVSVGSIAAAKLFGVKTIAIVTDIPSYMQAYVKEEKAGFKSLLVGFYTSLCGYFIKHYHAYIILSKQMNELINSKNNPYIVIEGMANLEMREIENLLEDKHQESVIIYAGALHEKYGLKKLVEAFVKVQINDAQFWIYGSGEMENEIKEYEKRDSRIKYFGVVHNSVVVQEELRATLLVNPRPSDEEFTKYSFPSKNMEYMVSGTPLLTTKLPSMPEEYYDYVYLFEDESVDGMAKTLERVLGLPKEELHAKGAAAKDFVLREKSNVVQARRIIDLISGIAGKSCQP